MSQVPVATELLPQQDQGDLLAAMEHLPNMWHIRPHSPVSPGPGCCHPLCTESCSSWHIQGEAVLPWPHAATKAGVSLQSGDTCSGQRQQQQPARTDPVCPEWEASSIASTSQSLPAHPGTVTVHPNTDPGRAPQDPLHLHPLQLQHCTHHVSVTAGQGRCCCSEAATWICHLKQSLGRVTHLSPP